MSSEVFNSIWPLSHHSYRSSDSSSSHQEDTLSSIILTTTWTPSFDSSLFKNLQGYLSDHRVPQDSYWSSTTAINSAISTSHYECRRLWSHSNSPGIRNFTQNRRMRLSCDRWSQLRNRNGPSWIEGWSNGYLITTPFFTR